MTRPEPRLKILERLARWCAVVAGVLLTGVTLMTCASVLGRNTAGATLVGDFELTGVVAGVVIALFLPWCQVRRGNIIVDFFTARSTPRTRSWLDRAGALLLSLTMALLAWRATVGGLDAYATHSGSMLLGFPDWVVYAGIVPPLALTAVIALTQTWLGFAEDPA